MSLQETERRARQRKASHRQRKPPKHREDHQHRAPPIVVYKFLDWCKMRGISSATGRRLAKAGRVKLTDLSDRRVGVRSDHDQEYLDSCLRNS